LKAAINAARHYWEAASNGQKQSKDRAICLLILQKINLRIGQNSYSFIVMVQFIKEIPKLH
jgi:hypothetical protein